MAVDVEADLRGEAEKGTGFVGGGCGVHEEDVARAVGRVGGRKEKVAEGGCGWGNDGRLRVFVGGI